jgi:hypothetical protein
MGSVLVLWVERISSHGIMNIEVGQIGRKIGAEIVAKWFKSSK